MEFTFSTVSVSVTQAMPPSPSPSLTMGTDISSTVRTTTLPKKNYYEYKMKMTLTEINKVTEKKGQEQTLEILSKLISDCSKDKTMKSSAYYIKFQAYLKDEICGIRSLKAMKCDLTVTVLKCGGLIASFTLVLEVDGSEPGGDAGKIIEDEIENGTLGAFTVKNGSFVRISKSKIAKPKPTKEPPQAQSNAYVIVTMKCTWYLFCTQIEEDFREAIANTSSGLIGKTIKPSSIVFVNSEANCRDPNNKTETIKVWFVILESDEDTIRIGKHLKDLAETGQLGKLGPTFEDKVTSVFHSILPPPARNYDSKMIFLCSFSTEGIRSGLLVVEKFQLLFDLLLMVLKNN